MDTLEERIATLEAWIADHADAHSMALEHTADINTAWLVWCGILVFCEFMPVYLANPRAAFVRTFFCLSQQNELQQVAAGYRIYTVQYL